MNKLSSEYDQIISDVDFREAIVAGDDTQIKSASAAGSRLTRSRLRENSFFDNILEAKPVQDSDLAYLDDTEFPVVICEMEAESPGAVTVPFSDTPDSYTPTGRKFRVEFSEQTTPEFNKNIWLLKAYKEDLRAYVTDNALKDLHTEIDARGIRTVDRMVGAVNSPGASGLVQNTETNGIITRESLVPLKNNLEDRDLLNGAWLINRKTANEFLKMRRDEVGGTLSQEMLQEGAKAVQKFRWLGVDYVLTLKRNLVPDYTFYQFAPANYLGKHYVLQAPTLFMKRDKDILKWSVSTKTGMTLANVSAAHKHRFTYGG